MNFALILFLLLLATGVLWVVDKLVFARRRAPEAPEPWWVEYGASFFPVILIVFVLRSFVVEPFRIPSGSMIPTLQVGDFILVNKYAYGVRLPIVNKKVIDVGSPKRGDVMVFRYPEDPTLDYIKRVVGLPGDRVEYQNKRLFINGEEVPLAPEADYLHADRLYYSKQYTEKLGGVEHAILNDTERPAFISEVHEFPQRENCIYNNAGLICTVPPGHYFMMGDNRDASSDSRVWGFVPDQNIVGKAFFVWFHAKSLLPPAGIDFDRLGSFQ